MIGPFAKIAVADIYPFASKLSEYVVAASAVSMTEKE